MNLDEDIQRGLAAEELLANSTFNWALAEVRKGLCDAWAASPIRDIDGQHELRLLLKALSDLEGVLRSTIAAGKLAKIEVVPQRRGVRPDA